MARQKQVSEMTDEELKAYKEAGAEEGDLSDYAFAAGGAAKAAKGIGSAIKFIGQKAIQAGAPIAKKYIESLRDVPGMAAAESITYSRNPVTKQQDMLVPPAVKPLISSGISGVSIPPAAGMEGGLPTPAQPPKGTIRRRKSGEEEVMSPEEVAGAY